jgi:hypothetical protein
MSNPSLKKMKPAKGECTPCAEKRRKRKERQAELRAARQIKKQP